MSGTRAREATATGRPWVLAAEWGLVGVGCAEDVAVGEGDVDAPEGGEDADADEVSGVVLAWAEAEEEEEVVGCIEVEEEAEVVGCTGGTAEARVGTEACTEAEVEEEVEVVGCAQAWAWEWALEWALEWAEAWDPVVEECIEAGAAARAADTEKPGAPKRALSEWGSVGFSG